MPAPHLHPMPRLEPADVAKLRISVDDAIAKIAAADVALADAERALLDARENPSDDALWEASHVAQDAAMAALDRARRAYDHTIALLHALISRCAGP